MGIIMERLNNSAQQLQDSVVSAYENVSSGIVENAKSSGIAGLDSTFEIFSDSNFTAADANSGSAVSEPAAYPGPVESLANDSPILQTLKDQGFRPEREIASLFGPGWDKGSGWLNQLFKSMKLDKLNSDRAIDGELADGAARKQAKGPVSDVVPDPPTTISQDSSSDQKLLKAHWGGYSPAADPSQIQDALGWADMLNDQTIDGKLADGAARKQAKGRVSEVVPDPPSAIPDPSEQRSMFDPSDSPGSRLNRYFDRPLHDEIIKLGPEHKGAEPPEILEGGADPKKFYDARGANIVMNFEAEKNIQGKAVDALARNQYKGPVSDVTPDPPTALPPSVIPPPQQTYFQTIDQTAEQLQLNPQPETAQILQQQFTAVQEMASATQESVQLYQQLNSNLLLVR